MKKNKGETKTINLNGGPVPTDNKLKLDVLSMLTEEVDVLDLLETLDEIYQGSLENFRHDNPKQRATMFYQYQILRKFLKRVAVVNDDILFNPNAVFLM